MPLSPKPPCAICAYPSPTRCSGCQRVSYCSKAHQKQAWPTHRSLCKIYSSPTPPPPNTYCGLCGARANLTLTPCCSQTICNDSAKYQPGSFAATSCWRNHERYTLCALHFANKHQQSSGTKTETSWRDCETCRGNYTSKESYIAQGTSSYNFLETTKWDIDTSFQPAKCDGCQKQVKLATDAHSPMPGGKVQCTGCLMAMVGGSEGLGAVGMMDGTGTGIGMGMRVSGGN